MFNYTARSRTPNTAFSWRRMGNANITGTAAAGVWQNGNIIGDLLTNTTTIQQTVTYEVRMRYGLNATDTCEHIEVIELIVNPTPALSSSLANDTICSGEYFSYTLTSGTPSVNYVWNRPRVTGISQQMGFGTTPYITEILTNTTASPVDVHYHFTLEANGCSNTTYSKTVTVNPVPQISITNASPIVLSVGGTNSVTGTTTATVAGWTWTSSNPAIVSITAGAGTNSITILANNVGTATLTVTAENAVGGCPGTATILVNVGAAPIATLSLATGGAREICNDGSTLLRVDIINGTAPFRIVYTNDADGQLDTVLAYSSSTEFEVNPPHNSGTVQQVVTYSLAEVSYGTGYSVNIQADGEVPIRVNPTVRVTDNLSEVTICQGSVVSNRSFTSASDPKVSYAWTNDNPNIGLAVNGTGAIASFIAQNPLGSATTANGVVSPSYRGTISCPGRDTSFTISVDPKPSFSVIAPAPICIGEDYTFAAATDLQSITPVGSLATFYADYACSTPVTTVSPVITNTYFVRVQTAAPANCYSDISEITVTVKPRPGMTSAKTETICSNERLEYIISTDLGSGVLYSWTRAALAGINGNSAASGNNSTIREQLINSTFAPITVIYSITMTAQGCPTVDTLRVTVNPKPTLNSTTTTPICSGTIFSFSPASDVAGCNFSWERMDMAGILEAPASGTGNISEILTNTTANPIQVSYLITVESGGCSTTQQIRVTVNPSPILSSSLENRAICSGASFIYNATSATRNATFTWTRAAVAGNAATSGTTGVINETLTNNTSSDNTAVYRITTAFDGCTTTDSILVTIYPQVNITSVLTPAAICSEEYFDYTLTSNILNANYTWRRQANPNIQQAITSGINHEIYEQLTIRNSGTAVPVVYIVRAEANGCMSVQENITVNVNPKPTVQMITPTPLNMAVTNIDTVQATTNGDIVGWISSNTNVATVMQLSSDPTKAEIVAIGQGIAEITLSVINSITGCTNEVTFIVNVEAAHTAVLTLSANGASEICSGSATMLEVTINGGRPPFMVVYEHSGINDTLRNVGASVHRFMVQPDPNTGNAPQVITYQLVSVTESGPQAVVVIPSTVDITVNPVPAVTTVFATPYTYCEGDVVNNLPTFTSAATPTNRVTYQWQNDNPAIGLGMSGTTSSIAHFIADNEHGTQISADIVVTPYYRGLLATCEGTPTTFTIIVNPKPDFMVVNPDPICKGESYDFAANAGSLIHNIIPTGSIIHFYTDRACTNEILSIVSPVVTTTYFVRLSSTAVPTACNSAVQEIVLTVKPLPQLTSAKVATLCSGEPFEYEATSHLSGVSYEWTRAAVAGISNPATNGYGYRIRETLVNTTGSPIEVLYSIKMTATDCDFTDTVRVMINPMPKLNNIPTALTICSGSNFVYTTPTATVAATTITWTRVDNIQISEPSNTGTGTIDEQLTNLGTTPTTVTYEFTLSKDGCSNTEYVRVVVNPIPYLSSTLAPGEICSATVFNYIARTATRGATFSWVRRPNANITPAPGAATNSATISETLTNSSTIPVIVYYEVTMFANGCANTDTVELIVNPIPQLDPATLIPYNKICSGDAFVFPLESLTPNTAYSWYRIPNSQIVEAPSHSNSLIISETLTNRSTSVAHVAYKVITEANGCRNMGDTVKVDVNILPAVAITSPTPVNVTVNNTHATTASIAADCIAAWTVANASIATVTVNAADQTRATVAGMARGITEGILTITDTITGCSNTITFVINVEAEQVAQLQVPQGYVPQVCTGDSTMLEIWLSGGDIPFAFEYTDGTTTYRDTAYTGTYRFRVYPQTNATNSPVTTTYTLTSVKDHVNQTLTIVGQPVIVTTNPVARVHNILSLFDTICEGTLVEIPAFVTNVVPANKVRFQWENDNPSIGLGLSGNVNIPRFIAANTLGTIQEGIITVHPIYTDLISCPGTDTLFAVVVEPTPKYVVVHPDPICSGTNFDFTAQATNIVQGVVPMSSIIQFFSDRDCTVEVFTQTPAVTTTYYVKLTSPFGCESVVKEVVISVNTIPDVDAVSDYMICNHEGVNIHFVGHYPYTQFHWFKSGTDNTDITGLADNGHNFIEALTLTNNTAFVQEQEITVVPELNSSGGVCLLACGHAEHIICTGDSITFTIIVNPTPVLNSTLTPTAICSGTAFNYTPTSLTPDVTISWEREANSNILEVPLSGTASIVDTLTNLTQQIVQVRYRVTLDTNGCSHVQYVTVNVLPTPMLTSPLDAGSMCSGKQFTYTPTSAVAGSTFVWTRLPNPYITELATTGTASISEVLTNNAILPTIVEYEVISTANGCPHTQIVKVLVAPKPVVDPIADQEVCNGSLSNVVYFSGVATGYTWSIDENVGLPQRGTGYLPVGIVNHTQSVAVDATVSVVPVYALPDTICLGDTGRFVITVNPIPIVNPMANIVLCDGANVDVALSGNASTKFICTTLTSVGMADSVIVNAGSNLTFTAINTTNAPVTAVITVVPVYESSLNECYGKESSFAITVNPIPSINPTQDITVCAGSTVTATNFYGEVAGAIYTWTFIDGDTIVGIPTTGVAHIPPFTAINLTDDPITATFEVVASYTFLGETCSEISDTFNITIYPKPFIEPILDVEYCAQATTTAIPFVGNSTLNTYDWRIVTGANIGLNPTYGTGDELPSFVTENVNSFTRSVQIEVTPRIDGTACTGNPIYFNIMINPVAVLSSALTNDTICAGNWFDYIATSVSNNVFFSWTRPAIGGMAELNSQGAVIHEHLYNNTDAPIVVEYHITLSYERCDNIDTTSIVVKPTPVIVLDSAYYHACEGDVVVDITYTIDRPNLPISYKIIFDDVARSVGFLNTVFQPVVNQGVITVNIPANAPYGSYLGTLYIESLDCPAAEGYPFMIVVAPATKITKQPAAEIVMCENFGSLMIYVEAEGEGLSYQWYHDGVAIPGANSSIYEVLLPTAADYGEYYVIVSGMCGTVQSNTVKVIPAFVEILMKWDNVLFVSRIDTNGHNLRFTEYLWFKLDDRGIFIPLDVS